jgi:chemotaxis protein CheZ
MTDAVDPTAQRDKVVKIISSVIEKVEAAEEVSREAIYKELRALHDLIEETRREISATQLSEVSGKQISTATDELDAVVAATEDATSTIMDACEAISAHCETLPSPSKDILIGDVTKILEACSFQDITGQRITKVVKSIKIIEDKISQLMGILEDKIPGLPSAFIDEDTRTGDAKLLNGPQMPDKAISQADIDKLLADLF